MIVHNYGTAGNNLNLTKKVVGLETGAFAIPVVDGELQVLPLLKPAVYAK